MATLSVIARPYAQAAFEFAQNKKELAVWGTMLETLAATAASPAVSKLLSNTSISPQQWYALFSDVAAPYLNDSRKNFLRILTENKRLGAIAAIVELFKEYEAEHNQLSEVEVISAVPLSAVQQEKLKAKLSRLLDQEVNLRYQIDESILGGVIVRAGDKVIDGSVRGQLTRLLEFATQ